MANRARPRPPPRGISASRSASSSERIRLSMARFRSSSSAMAVRSISVSESVSVSARSRRAASIPQRHRARRAPPASVAARSLALANRVLSNLQLPFELRLSRSAASRLAISCSRRASAFRAASLCGVASALPAPPASATAFAPAPPNPRGGCQARGRRPRDPFARRRSSPRTAASCCSEFGRSSVTALPPRARSASSARRCRSDSARKRGSLRLPVCAPRRNLLISG